MKRIFCVIFIAISAKLCECSAVNCSSPDKEGKNPDIVFLKDDREDVKVYGNVKDGESLKVVFDHGVEKSKNVNNSDLIGNVENVGNQEGNLTKETPLVVLDRRENATGDENPRIIFEYDGNSTSFKEKNIDENKIEKEEANGTSTERLDFEIVNKNLINVEKFCPPGQDFDVNGNCMEAFGSK